jgi:hypothetical protein
MELSNTDIQKRRFYSVRFMYDRLGGEFMPEYLNEVSEELKLYPILANNEIYYHSDVWEHVYGIKPVIWWRIQKGNQLCDPEIDFVFG